MRRVLFFAVIFACVLPVFAQAKHPFTFEDMMKLKRVEEPEVSPDGKWVLFAAVDVDLADNTKTPHVWVVRVPHPSPVLGRWVTRVPEKQIPPLRRMIRKRILQLRSE
jgi:hypothetical protein